MARSWSRSSRDARLTARRRGLTGGVANPLIRCSPGRSTSRRRSTTYRASARRTWLLERHAERGGMGPREHHFRDGRRGTPELAKISGVRGHVAPRSRPPVSWSSTCTMFREICARAQGVGVEMGTPQLVKEMIAQMESDYQAARLAAGRLVEERRAPDTRETGLAKWFATVASDRRPANAVARGKRLLRQVPVAPGTARAQREIHKLMQADSCWGIATTARPAASTPHRRGGIDSRPWAGDSN